MIFASDTRAVEATTGWYISLLSMWIWWADAFTHVFTLLHKFAGYEWIVAAVAAPYGLLHVWVAHHGYFDQRAASALVVAFFMAALGVTVAVNQSWRLLGVPACGLTVLVQIWIYWRLQLEIHNG